jgi:hypothetical protein
VRVSEYRPNSDYFLNLKYEGLTSHDFFPRGVVMNRSEEFRSAAAECLILIHTTTDASSRARLLTMAQKWFAWADGQCGSERLEGVLREFNDQQMAPR